MKTSIHSAIILAAGKNTRFDTGKPKSLQPIGQVTLLERQIRQLHRAGIRHIGLITGFRGDVLEKYIHELNPNLKFPVTIIRNEQFERGNGLSILAARYWFKELQLGTETAFLCTMADHVFGDDFYDRLMREVKPSKRNPQPLEPAILHLAVDMVSGSNTHIDVEDVTKVVIDLETAMDTSYDPESVTGAHIVEIGKHLRSYSYYDTGCFLLREGVFNAVEEASRSVGEGISDTVTLLTKRNEARVIDVSGVFWSDVDTPEDFETTTKLLNAEKPRFA
ncbi:MAG: NTP transferase domain-containing protein [Bacteroidetes bacterium]|nr:NTP transferase domain-containing protein [Bacteroidota bacterium]MCH8524764.1 NTP transferase domain-containing protein [Balneolales bacterium]